MHPSLKPFAAWATDLIDRFRFNLFYRTAAHVILLQVALALVSILIFAWSIQAAEERTALAITAEVENLLAGNAASTTSGLPEIADVLKERAYTYAFAALVLLNAVFGFLIARFALWPTRNSLQFQKRFIGNIAHEIRTPLAIIKTNTEVALFDSKLQPQVRETFEETIVELDRISETINNLLSFDTLTRPRRMQFEPTDLGSIVESVIRHHEALADSRGVTLHVRIGERRMVHGNAVALDQVVTNLVKNAINYTPKDKNGSVTVSVAGDGPGKVALTVADTGIGIEQKDLFHIFEPFYRGDTSRARGIGTGTSGLGLAIVNEIVRLHKGSINIRSAPGQGTEFRITLPASGRAEPGDPLLSGTKDETSEISVDFS